MAGAPLRWQEMRLHWEDIQGDAAIMCKDCARGGKLLGRKETEKDVKYKCRGIGCSSDAEQKQWCAMHFEEKELVHAAHNGENAKRARCRVVEDDSIQKVVECTGCGIRKRERAFRRARFL